jgi:hypothetical protein
MTVYVACKFRPEDSRAYTYEWDGEPLAIGDTVKVADARSDGWKRVQVVSITDEAPPFACKPILGKIDPDAEILAKIEAGTADPNPSTDALSAPVVEF